MSTHGAQVQLTIEGAVVATATLEGHASARDFVALLPLKLILEDYAAMEKVAVLPRPLTTTETIAACMPSAGDVSFYVPWGNIAIFYNDGQLSQGLVRLGRLDSGLSAIRRRGPMAVTFELARE